MDDITTISLERKTRDKLAELGNKDDNFDDIVNRLIASYKESEKEGNKS